MSASTASRRAGWLTRLAAPARDLASSRALVRLEAAFAAAGVAEQASWVVVLWWAYAARGSGFAGLVMFVLLVPTAALAPGAGWLAGRVGVTRALVAVYAAQAVSLAVAGCLILAGAPTALVVVAAAVATVFTAWMRPVHVPACAEASRTMAQAMAATSLTSTLDGLALFVGPLGAGLVVAAAGPGVSLLALAALLVAAALLCLTLGRPARASRPGGGPAGTVPADLSDGGRDPLAVPLAPSGLRLTHASVVVLMSLLLAEYAVWGALDLLAVSLSSQRLGTGSAGAGLIMGIVGVGGVVGAAATFRLGSRRMLAGPITVGMVAGGMALGLVPALPGLALVAVAVGCYGAARAWSDTTARALLQRVFELDGLARVFSVQAVVETVGLALGMLLGPLLVAAFGPGDAYLPLAAGMLLVGLATIPALRVLDAHAFFMPDLERLLLGVPFLASLDLAHRERLARTAGTRSVPAGTAVVQEGSSGTSMYVLSRGAVRVTRSGHPQQVRLAAGEQFGEMGLLTGAPRMATVTATEPTDLVVLDRRDLLDAIGGSDSQLHAQSVVEQRLRFWQQ